MENFQSGDEHIEEISVLLETFDLKYKQILKEVKIMNIVSLKKDLVKYQNSWENDFNKTIINKMAKKVKNDELKFNDHELLREVLEKQKLAKLPNKFTKVKGNKGS